jgi:hypothetical protein
MELTQQFSPKQRLKYAAIQIMKEMTWFRINDLGLKVYDSGFSLRVEVVLTEIWDLKFSLDC